MTLLNRLFITVFLLIFSSSGVLAHGDLPWAIGASIETPTAADQKEDIKDEIKRLEDKIRQLQGREKSLQDQIDSLDNQMALINLKINKAIQSLKEKESELLVLTSDIGIVSEKIVKLQHDVIYQTNLLAERAKLRYKTDPVTPLELAFSSNINQLIQKVRFLQSIQEEDAKIIAQLRDTKKSFEEHKITLEDKKKKIEEVKASIELEKNSLVNLRGSLATQKREKDVLLQQTKGDEATYQDLLKKAKAELEAFNNAVAGTTFARGTDVKAGEIIAIMGNSGAPYCSTGAHLHFEVRKNGVIVNSENYVKAQTLFVYDYSSGVKSIGTGAWSWPMYKPQITQRFGRTPWSRVYANNLHTGVDMVASNTYIYAPADGKFTRGSVNCYGVRMNYAAIDHGSGIISYYFHIK